MLSRGPDAIDRRMIERLQRPLPMCERPFVVLAQELGRDETELIDRLRHLLSQGVVARFGPLWTANPGEGRPAFASLDVPEAELDRDLMTATATGLPLLARPFEALGAMLGVSGDAVRARLEAMLADGRIRRIGIELSGGSASP